MNVRQMVTKSVNDLNYTINTMNELIPDIIKSIIFQLRVFKGAQHIFREIWAMRTTFIIERRC